MNPFQIHPEECVWDVLARETAPLVLYGTGNGGDKMIAALAKIEKKPDGVFASDGFVRSRTFHDMPVLSHEEAVRQFGKDMVVLVSFGSPLPEVMENMRSLSRQHRLYIPELPLIDGPLFDYAYFLLHRPELEATCRLLADEFSRALFADMISYRLRGQLHDLSRTEPFVDSLRSLIPADTVHTILDGGAFNGDSARDLLTAFPNCRRLDAVEPDVRTFRKLSAYAETTNGIVHPHHLALGSEPCETEFAAAGSRGSGVNGSGKRAKTVTVSVSSIDTLFPTVPPDLIKLDVEGAESAALRGAVNTIRRRTPAWIVSLYHRTEDLFSIPLYMESLVPGQYSFYLRRVTCYPAWDLMLYAIPGERLGSS